MHIPSLLFEDSCNAQGFSVASKNVSNINPRKQHILYVGFDLLVIQSLQVGVSIEIRNQLVMPISLLDWLIDVIENQFWKKPSEGGLPKNKHFVEVEQGEEKLVGQRAMHAGAENEMGFSSYNKGRRCHIIPKDAQLSTIADVDLTAYLLDEFKRIAQEYQ